MAQNLEVSWGDLAEVVGDEKLLSCSTEPVRNLVKRGSCRQPPVWLLLVLA